MSSLAGPLWLVVREYAGLAEAGGVKNVSRSLAEGLARSGEDVTVFLPFYGFMDVSAQPLFSLTVTLLGEKYEIQCMTLPLNGVRIILIGSPVYSGKHQVYVYTDDEASLIPGARRGLGHFDVDVMNQLLQESVIAFALKTGEKPAVVHCHDAHTALLPALARRDKRGSAHFGNTAFFVTIHNAGPGYRQTLRNIAYAEALTGLDPQVLSSGSINGRIEPFLVAASFAVLTTVSPWYALELTEPLFDSHTEGLSGEFRRRGISVSGITNGIDRFRYCPRFPEQSLLPFAFDPLSGDLAGKYRCRNYLLELIASGSVPKDFTIPGALTDSPDAVWFCYQGRIAQQKGLSVLVDAVHLFLESNINGRFVAMGQGDPILEKALAALAWSFPGRFLFICGYERALARLVVASSDFLVLPSEFEPCGLEDYIAQIYGTLPIARAVGGLNKIRHGETGFLYGGDTAPNSPHDLAAMLEGVANEFLRRGGSTFIDSHFLNLIRAAARFVGNEADWDTIIRESYLPLYQKNIPAAY